jgi:hypothetical protein
VISVIATQTGERVEAAGIEPAKRSRRPGVKQGCDALLLLGVGAIASGVAELI